MSERYLTPLQAARLCEWVGSDQTVSKQFIRAVLDKEKRSGKPIFIRRGSHGIGVRYKITRAIMRRRLNELFDDEKRALEEVRVASADLRRKVDDVYERQAALLKAMERLTARVVQLERKRT